MVVCRDCGSNHSHSACFAAEACDRKTLAPPYLDRPGTSTDPGLPPTLDRHRPWTSTDPEVHPRPGTLEHYGSRGGAWCLGWEVMLPLIRPAFCGRALGCAWVVNITMCVCVVAAFACRTHHTAVHGVRVGSGVENAASWGVSHCSVYTTIHVHACCVPHPPMQHPSTHPTTLHVVVMFGSRS